ncbi:hypothetical protein [Yersinia kristensenii]|uniref:hypothetical protein n=1 Tax=Yersinia kristensenii TaxID=28152 RepID=UPI0005E0EAD9|nr:hypothetical protein [Yersinia kristensenii]CNG28736.1 Uncharacterised protein [Yersinia kristensenii]CNJ68248.1 Uncharacterised protein [Yersinia kristensenii]
MSIEEKKECKAAYLDALSISPVDRATLKTLHVVNDNTLDKWLYVADRYPTFRACWELWMFLRKRRLPVSKNLNRLIQRSVTRANAASASLGRPLSDNGEVLASKGWIRSTNTYLYKDKHVRLADVWQELGYKSETQLRSKVWQSKIKPSDDISHLIASTSVRSRPLKKYTYRGTEFTLPELSRHTGLSEATIKNRIVAAKIKGTDISKADFDKYSAGGPPRRLTDAKEKQ